MRSNNEMPGHLARRFQQIAVAIFHAEVAKAASDVTPVQYAALEAIRANPGIDQATLAGLIAHDRATITGVVDRLAQKALLVRQPSPRDRRARELHLTEDGQAALAQIRPAVDAAQDIMLRGLDADESEELMRLLLKAVTAVNDLSRAPMRAEAHEGRTDGRNMAGSRVKTCP